MGEMTASIAHEINQPVTAISMYAHACLRMLAKSDIDLAKI
jgi:two-component system sensor kinase FixL